MACGHTGSRSGGNRLWLAHEKTAVVGLFLGTADHDRRWREVTPRSSERKRRLT